MGVPKKRMSRQKRDSRRAHWKATAPNVLSCTNCGAPVLPHRACPACGFYKGKAAVKATAE